MNKLIAQRYAIAEELGSGGMGTVYKGEDTQTDQIVAIKQLHANLADEELIERFKREGEALRDLNHPNIVKMLDAVEEDDNYYLVMEYVSGGDLSNLLQAEQLSLERILNIAIDLADALTRAHRLNIIHRDLKPANVLIGADNVLRLTDFGVAHVGSKERVTATDAIVGTIDYLSPETLNAEEIDPRADIWAFGIVLFEMLTGERPFTNPNLLTNILIQSVPDLEQLRPDITVSLVDLVYRMLEKDRNARIQSVRQVGLELEDLLYERVNHTPPEPRFAPPTQDVFSRPEHNLPAQVTPFVGRESELNELIKLVENPNIRFITILAPGGMGKTRLALEAAQRQLSQFDNGVWFVDLAPLSDPTNIVATIADAMGYQFQGDGRDSKQQILDFLKNKNALLVLDNYEHLLEGFGLVTDILQDTPNIQVVVTSRQRLGQAGETLFHLSGMDFPDWQTTANDLDYSAVKLFMNSATRAQPSFELTADNLDHVARICHLVEGMPLGIVLAASWLAMLSPKEITDEIQQSIDILIDEGGQVPTRQRSIRAVLDYSWQQMTETEQKVFMKMSVFRGGFTREAAQEVTGASLRDLLSLVNKSLIRREVDNGRFSIHELLRQYSHEMLSVEGQNQIRQAQAEYYTTVAQNLDARMKSRQQIQALQDCSIEIENLRVAWNWAIKHQIGTVILAMSHLFWLFHHLKNTGDVAIDMFGKVIEAFPNDAAVSGDALAKQAWFLALKGQEADDNLHQSINLLRTTKEREKLAFALLISGWAGSADNPIGVFEEALSIYIEIDDSFGRAFCETDLMVAYSEKERIEDARRASESVLNLIQQEDLGYFTIGWAYLYSGILGLRINELSMVVQNLDNALENFQLIGDTQGIFFCHNFMADYYKRLELPERAIGCYLTALTEAETNYLDSRKLLVLRQLFDTLRVIDRVDIMEILINVYQELLLSDEAMQEFSTVFDTNETSSVKSNTKYQTTNIPLLLDQLLQEFQFNA